MPSPEYPQDVLEYVESQSWSTNITELREGSYIIAASRQRDSNSEKMLLMIVCEPEDLVSEDHLKYLLKMGQNKNVDSVTVTYTIEISDRARELCEEYNINVLDSEKVQSSPQLDGFNVDNNEISFPDTQTDSIDNVDTSEDNSTKEEIYKIQAKYTQPDGRSVRGTLILSLNSLRFKLHLIAKLRLGKSVEVSYDEIQDLDREEKFSRGMKDIILGRGWRDRLKIETKDGRELLFVVSDIDDTINKIRTLRRSDSVPHQSFSERSSKQEGESEEPQTLTLGRTASWLVGGFTIYVGLELFANQGHLGGLLYFLAGIIVTPYTRKYVESYIGVKFGRWFLVAAWLGLCFIASLMYAAVAAQA